jgi:hypothetical protein
MSCSPLYLGMHCIDRCSAIDPIDPIDLGRRRKVITVQLTHICRSGGARELSGHTAGPCDGFTTPTADAHLVLAEPRDYELTRESRRWVMTPDCAHGIRSGTDCVRAGPNTCPLPEPTPSRSPGLVGCAQSSSRPRHLRPTLTVTGLPKSSSRSRILTDGAGINVIRNQSRH